MMRKMREQTKWIMLITALSFVALMVFEWGMDLSGRSSAQASGGELGRIDGDPVTYDEYLTIYRSLYDQQQAAQEDPISPMQNRQIEEAAWAQLVQDELIRQELARRGLRATEEEIRQAARYAPPPEFMRNELFQTDGQFDLTKYHQFLSSPAVDRELLLQLERYYRDLIPRSKLVAQVTAGIHPTDSELWQMWRDARETARVRFIALRPGSLVPDAQVSVTDAEVARYYREHREEFAVPARATLRAVALPKQPLAADSAASLERARAVRAELAGGASFAEVAARESADPGSAAQGGDLGSFARGQMVAPFDQAVWSLPIGQVSEPVRTQFGYHLIEVQSRDSATARARHILIPIERTDESEEALLVLADSLEALGEAGSLQEAARTMGLQVQSATVEEEMPFVSGIGRIDEAIDWLFAEALEGEVSPVYESSTAFYMVELVDLTPERVLRQEEAAEQIRSTLTQQKKLEKARTAGRELVEQLRAGRSLDEVAQARGLTVETTEPFTRMDFVPGLGQANAAIGTAFGLRDGQVSGLVESDGTLFILQLVSRTEANREEWEQQKDMQRARVTASLEQQRWTEFLAALEERAEIVDLRDQVLRGSGQQQTPAPPPVF